MKNTKICLGCLREINIANQKCFYCGFDPLKVQNPRYLRVGIRLKNRYLVGKKLGEGGFGITYVGYDTLKNCPVAIKEYFPSSFSTRDMSTGRNKDVQVFDGKGGKRYQEGLLRFEKEGKSLKKIGKCSNIVQVKDYFEENNTGYLVMEYVPGITLYEWVEENGKMPWQDVVGLTQPLIENIIMIHKKGILHRDISPDNIILRPDGVAKLIDFGSARKISIDEGQQDKSMTVVVRQQYAPKEQYFRRGNQGPWTDVYSFMATWYFLMTGKVPAPVLEREAESVEHGLVESMSELPEEVQSMIIKGMAISTEDRFQNFEEILEKIKKLPVGSEGKTILERTVYFDREKAKKRVMTLRTKRRIKTVAGIMVLILLVLGAGFGFHLAGKKTQATGKAEITEKSQDTQESEVTEKPVTTAKPKVTKKPVVTEKPKETKKPVVTKKPEVTKKPMMTKKPQATKKPVVMKKSQVAKKPQNKNQIQIITD